MDERAKTDLAVDELAEALARYHDQLLSGVSDETPREPATTSQPSTGEELRADQQCLELIERVRRRYGESLAPLLRRERRPDLPTDPMGPAERTIARFRIIRELARGGHGVVLLAHDPVAGRDVALKVPRAESLFDAEMRTRFLGEARAAGRLTHPGIVPVYEVQQVGPVCYIASQYCRGPTLRRWLAERTAPVPPRVAAQLMLDLSCAIAYAHSQGVLHRDVKPSNVLLDLPPDAAPCEATRPDPAGSGCELQLVPKLTDFGLAKLLESTESVTRTGVLMGTPAYMAPEQAGGRPAAIGPRTDVYALGAVLYELLAGCPPLEGNSEIETLQRVVTDEPQPLGQLRADVPRDLAAIAAHCLEKEPERRYATASALADDLARYLAGEPTVARASGPAERLFKWSKRHPALAALVAISVVAAMLVAVLLLISVAALRRATQNENALKQSNDQLVTALDESRELQHEAARRLYAVDLQRAFEAWHSADVGLARRLLAGHVPRSNMPEVRGFEWHFLRERLDQSARSFDGHEGSVNIVAVSPDGEWIASGGEDRTVRLWHTHAAKPARVLGSHVDGVTSLAFSPDGARLVSASGDGAVRLWSVATGAQLDAWSLENTVSCVQIARSKPLVAAAGPAGEVRVWSTDDGALVGAFAARQQVVSLQFAPGDDAILLASHVESRVSAVRRWHLRDGTLDVLVADVPDVIPSISVAHSGRYLASAHSDGSLRVWELPAGRLLRNVPVHTDKAMFVGFSPDDARLISCGRDRVVRVTPWREHQLELPEAVVRLASSPEGRHLCALASSGHAAFVWDRAADQLHVQPKTSGRWEFCEFSADGKRLVLGPQPLEIWDISNMSLARRFEEPESEVLAAAFDSTASEIVTVDVDGGIERWNIASGQRASLKTAARKVGLLCAAVLPERERVVLVRRDGLVQIRDAQTGEVRRTLDRRGIFEAVCSSPDGRWLALLARAQRIYLFDLDQGAEVARIEKNVDSVQSVDFLADGSLYVLGRNGHIEIHVPPGGPQMPHRVPSIDLAHDIAALPDGLVAVTSGGKSVLVLDTAPLAETSLWKGHAGAVWTAAVAPDGRHVASGGADGQVKWWDVAERDLHERRIPTRAERAFILHDGRIATGDYGGSTVIWDPAGTRPQVVLDAVDGPVKAIAPGGRHMLALAGPSREIYVVDARTGRRIAAAADHRAPANAAALSPDGRLLASGDIDGTVLIRDVAQSAGRVASLGGHSGAISFLMFSPDGRLLASTGHDRQVCVWDVESRELLHALRGHTGTPFLLAFAPDGKAIYSAGGDQTVRRWNAATGQELATLVDSEDPKALAVSPDGNTLAVGSASGNVVLWHVPTATRLGRLAKLGGEVRALRFNRTGSALTAVADRDTVVTTVTTLARKSTGPRDSPPEGHGGSTDDRPQTGTTLDAAANGASEKLIVGGGESVHHPGHLHIADQPAVFSAAARVASFSGEIESTAAHRTPTRVTLRDRGTQWLCADRIDLTSAGDVQLSVESGAQCVAGTLLSMSGSGACKATVRGVGSRLETKQFLNVSGGSLHVSDGGTMRCWYANISGQVEPLTSNVEVIVEGSNSLWEARERVLLGNHGMRVTARFTVREGARAEAGKGLSIFDSAVVDLQHGTIQAALVDVDGGVLCGAGEILGDLRNVSHIELSPADGALRVSGSFEQTPAGRLVIQAGRLSGAGAIPLLRCDGNARLSGILELRCGTTPQLGDSVELLSASSIEGEFTQLDLPPLPDTQAWRLQVENGRMTLIVAAASDGATEELPPAS